MDKIIIFFLLGLMVINMGFLIVSGRKATRSLPTPIAHKRGARVLLGITLVLIGVIERGVSSRGGLQHLDELFFIHVTVATMFLFLLILINFWLTGEKHPPLHGLLAYAALLMFAGMLITGIPLVLRLP